VRFMYYTVEFKNLIVAFFMVSLVSCSLHTVNTSPAPLVLSESFPLEVDETSAGATERPWWEEIKDNQLQDLIEQALESNLEIEQGLARFAQAQSLLRQAHGIRFPQIDIESRAGQSWDRNQRFSYQQAGGIAVGWDPDLFARLRNNELARLYELEAELFYLESLRLSISGQVAHAYFGAREQSLQLKLLRQQIETDQELLSLVKRSFDAGVVSRVDFLQQQGQLADTKTLIPLAELSLRLYENSLDVLLGTAPDGQSRIAQEESYPSLPLLPKLGIPADLLLNRPDLRARKAELIAADADIGRAIAEFLPRLTISGNALYTGGTAGAGLIADIGSSLMQPLLTWGIRRAEIERNRALYIERLYDFSQVFLSAMEEVDNSMFSIIKQQEYIARLETRKGIVEETLDETQRRYTAGLTDYLPVLDTLQELRSLERSMIAQERILMNHYVELYTSLGGLPLPEDVT